MYKQSKIGYIKTPITLKEWLGYYKYELMIKRIFEKYYSKEESEGKNPKEALKKIVNQTQQDYPYHLS